MAVLRDTDIGHHIYARNNQLIFIIIWIYSFYDREDFQLFIKVQLSLFVILGVIDPIFYFLLLQI